jgi:uncharacterized protein
VVTLPKQARARDLAAGAAVAVLGISNVVTNRWLPPAAYVPWNLTITAGLVVLAQRSGCGIAELGGDPRHLRRSMRVGAVGAGMVAVGYGMGLLTPAGADVFRDERVTSATTTTLLSHVVMRIPLGTVLGEEVTFRGVLPALLTSSRRPTWLPGAVASLLFGLWHVLPSLELPRANVGVRRVVGATPSGRLVALAVGVTTFAGAVLHCLRQQTGHLASPVAVHMATNMLGVLAGRLTRATGDYPDVAVTRNNLPHEDSDH